MNKNKIFFTPNQDDDSDNQEKYIEDDDNDDNDDKDDNDDNKLFKFKQRSDLSFDFEKIVENVYKEKDNDEVKIDMKESILLNQGGYGCVYHPAIKCENGKNKKIIKEKASEYISKIQFDDKSSRNEIEISKLLKILIIIIIFLHQL